MRAMKAALKQGRDHTLYEPMTRGCAAKLKALDRVGRLLLLTNHCLYCTDTDCEVCPICKSPLIDGKCSDVGDNGCRYST